MSSALARQLKLLATQSSVAGTVNAPSASVVPSLLFTKHVAADTDAETIYEIGINGLEQLAQIDSKFRTYETSLFNRAAVRLDTQGLSQQTQSTLNTTIHSFLTLLAPHFALPASHSCLEWLLRRFKVSFTHGEDLIDMAVPFHATVIGLKLIKLVDTKHESVKPVLKSLITNAQSIEDSPSGLSREHLINACRQDVTLFSHWMHIAHERKYRALISLCTALTCDIFGRVTLRSAELVSLISNLSPFIMRGLSSAAHTHNGLYSQSIVQLIAMGSVATLNAEMCNHFMVSMLCQLKSSSESAFHSVTVLALSNFVQTQHIRQLNSDSVLAAVSASALIPVLGELAAKYDVAAFVECLLVSVLDFVILHNHAVRPNCFLFLRSLIESQAVTADICTRFLDQIVEHLNTAVSNNVPLEHRVIVGMRSLFVTVDGVYPKAVEDAARRAKRRGFSALFSETNNSVTSTDNGDGAEKSKRKRRRDGSEIVQFSESEGVHKSMFARMIAGTRHAPSHANVPVLDDEDTDVSSNSSSAIISKLQQVESNDSKDMNEFELSDFQPLVERAFNCPDPSAAIAALSLHSLTLLPVDWLQSRVYHLIVLHSRLLTTSGSVPLGIALLRAAFRTIEKVILVSKPSSFEFFLPLFLEFSLERGSHTHVLSHEVRSCLVRVKALSKLTVNIEMSTGDSDAPSVNEKFIESLASAVIQDHSKSSLKLLMQIFTNSPQHAYIGCAIAGLCLNLVSVCQPGLISSLEFAAAIVQVYQSFDMSMRRAPTPASSFYACELVSLPSLMRFLLDQRAIKSRTDLKLFDFLLLFLSRLDRIETHAHMAPLIASLTKFDQARAQIVRKFGEAESSAVKIRCCEVLIAATQTQLSNDDLSTIIPVVVFAGCADHSRAVRAASIITLQSLVGRSAEESSLKSLAAALIIRRAEVIEDRTLVRKCLADFVKEKDGLSNHELLVRVALELSSPQTQLEAVRIISALDNGAKPITTMLLKHLSTSSDHLYSLAILDCLGSSSFACVAEFPSVDALLDRGIQSSSSEVRNRCAQLAVSVFPLLKVHQQKRVLRVLISSGSDSSVTSAATHLTLPASLVIDELKAKDLNTAIFEIISSPSSTVQNASDLALPMLHALKQLNEQHHQTTSSTPTHNDLGLMRSLLLSAMYRVFQVIGSSTLPSDADIAPVLQCLDAAYISTDPSRFQIRLAALKLLQEVARCAPDAVNESNVKIFQLLGSVPTNDQGVTSLVLAGATAVVACMNIDVSTVQEAVAASAAPVAALSAFIRATAAHLEPSSSVEILSIWRSLVNAFSPYFLFISLPFVCHVARIAGRAGAMKRDQMGKKAAKHLEVHGTPLDLPELLEFDAAEFCQAWLNSFDLSVRFTAFNLLFALVDAVALTNGSPLSDDSETVKEITLSGALGLVSPVVSGLDKGWFLSLLASHVKQVEFSAELVDIGDNQQLQSELGEFCLRLVRRTAFAVENDAHVNDLSLLRQISLRLAAMIPLEVIRLSLSPHLGEETELGFESLRLLAAKAEQTRVLLKQRQEQATRKSANRRLLNEQTEADLTALNMFAQPLIELIQSRVGRVEAQLPVVAFDAVVQALGCGTLNAYEQNHVARVQQLTRAAPVLLEVAERGPEPVTDAVLLALASLCTLCSTSLLPQLPRLTDAAIKRAVTSLARGSERAASVVSSLILIRSLLESMPTFLSAYLSQLSSILLNDQLDSIALSDCHAIAADCRALLVAQDSRLLLAELARFVQTYGRSRSSAAFFHFLDSFLDRLSQAEIRAMLKSIVRVFVIGLTGRLTADHQVSLFAAANEDLCVSSFVRFTLKMNETQLRASFNKIIQLTVPPAPSSMTDSNTDTTNIRITRAIPLVKLASALSTTLGAIFAPLSSAWLDPVLQLTLESCQPAHDVDVSVQREYLGLVIPAMSLALDLDEEHELAKMRTDPFFQLVSLVTGRLCTVVEPQLFVHFVVSLASNLAHFHFWKPLQIALVSEAQRNKGAKPESRALFLACLTGLFTKLGSSYLVMMPEVLPMISEFLEDEDADVSRQLKKLIAIVEELSGEKLDRHLSQ